MPSLHARLGPVKGVTFPAARRLVVALRAGTAVPHYSALEFCAAIWISVPEEALDGIICDLAAQTPLHKTVIVVCGSQRGSTSFDLLRAGGARIATLNLLDPSWQSAFVAEGHRDAVRLVRKLLSEDRRRVFELRAGMKDAFLAGVHMLTELLRPWTAAAVDCLAASGLPRPDAMSLAETLSMRAVRAYTKAGAQPWSAPTKEDLRRALDQRVDRLRADSPRQAQLYAEGLRLALEYFERRPHTATLHATAGHVL
jgi:hypothetical protein